MLNIVVFSKDRAMQLELFLRSFCFLVKDASLLNINVIYTASDMRFNAGYSNLISTSPRNVKFIEQGVFKQDVLSIIHSSNPYTVFFVDDNVFKEHVDLYDSQMDVFSSDDDIACRSLRLHPFLTYCYAEARNMKAPLFDDKGVFNWTKESGDYGYPMSLDGHIFRTNEILPMIQDIEYTNPNTMEGAMVHKRFNLGRKMICYQKSPLINNPINRVQTVNKNLCGNISAQHLNDKFLDGFVIDINPFLGLLNISCHQEVPLNFIRIEGICN